METTEQKKDTINIGDMLTKEHELILVYASRKGATKSALDYISKQLILSTYITATGQVYTVIKVKVNGETILKSDNMRKAVEEFNKY